MYIYCPMKQTPEIENFIVRLVQVTEYLIKPRNVEFHLCGSMWQITQIWCGDGRTLIIVILLTISRHNVECNTMLKII